MINTGYFVIFQSVNYILDHQDRTTLALISLKQITPKKVNYILRFNYTLLPNTNEAILRGSIGLNSQYQSYFTSGKKMFNIQYTCAFYNYKLFCVRDYY